MNNAIKQVVELCDACQQLRPSKPQEPLQSYAKCTEPMQGLSADLFEDKGMHYLVVCDRFSGYPFAYHLRKNQLTTRSITAKFDELIEAYGKPINITTDNGPQFREEYQEWCKSHGITPIHSSPYHHRSNSTAELAVKNCEYLLRKCGHNEKEFQKRLKYYRNTPSANSETSPSQKFFGRNLRTDMPTWHGKPIDLVTPQRQEQPFKVGDWVRVQNPITRQWDEIAKIAGIRASKRSYALIRKDSQNSRHSTLIRNRQFLKHLSRSERAKLQTT